MRYLWTLPPLLLLACGTTETTPGTTTTDEGAVDVTVADTATDEDTSCWWCTDAGPDADVPTLTKDATTTKPGKDPAGEKEYVIWLGKIDLTSGQGLYTYDYQMSGLKCSISYEVTSAVAAEDCESCTFAWSLTLGDISASVLPEKCPNGAGMEGETVHYGHVPGAGSDKGEGSQLMTDQGEGWVSVGVSIPDGDTGWTFYHILDPGGSKGGDGKGGDGKGGDGKGGDGKDLTPEECMEACLAKGASEADCQKACGTN